MISPGRLLDIQGAGDPVTVSQDNFEILTEEVWKVVPTYQSGTPTSVIGPPTTGDHILDELWKDAWNAWWRCTVAGTPGTWRQEKPAIRAGEPSSGTIPTGYVIWDSNAHYLQKYHAGGYVWISSASIYQFGGMTGLTGGGGANLDGVATTSLVVGTFAQFVVSGAIYLYRLRAGTDAEFSPFIIRPDDYAAATNEKVWERVERFQYPGDVTRELTGLTGSSATDLNGIPTTSLTVGCVLSFLVAGAYVVYRLRTGTDATLSPTVIRPVDFQSVTNPKVWERLLIVQQPGDVMLGTNNLSEINTAAKRIAARSNLDAPWIDDMRGAAEARGLGCGLSMNGSSSVKLTGTSGLAIGTSDFTISCTVRIANNLLVHLLHTHSTGNNKVYLRIVSGAVELRFVNNTGTDTAYSMSPDVALVVGETYQITVTVDRDGLATCYINGISDRDKSGSAVTVDVSAQSAVDIGNANANLWTQGQFLPGLSSKLRLFNYVLPADSVATLAKAGVVSYEDQWSTLPAVASYTSNFSAGVDGWTAGAGAAIAGNIDGIAGQDDTLRMTADATANAHNLNKASALTFKRYRVQAKVYIPSSNATIKQVKLSTAETVTTLDSWVTVDTTFTPTPITTTFTAESLTAGGITAGLGCNGDVFYLKDVILTVVGCVLDLDLENANPAQSLVIRDRSSNALDATAAASGVTQLSPLQQVNAVKGISVGSSSVMTKLLTATAVLNFGSIAAQTAADLTITVTGAVAGDSVALGLPAAPETGLVYVAFVSAADTVTVRCTNVTAAAIDPASVTIRATVFAF